MPERLRIDPYTFFFYSNEGDLYQPPSIFVRSENGEAEFMLSNDAEPEVFLKRSFGFSAEELLTVRDLMDGHLMKMRSDWVHAFT